MRISTVTGLEIGFSFRAGSQARREVAAPPLSLLRVEYLAPAIEDRAVDVQMLFADTGSIADPQSQTSWSPRRPRRRH